MHGTEGASTFQVSGAEYDRLIGRYSAQLAEQLVDASDLMAGQQALDIGCGPGGLTTVLVRRLGVDAVAAVDPSEPFVAECRRRNPGVDVRHAAAESLPFDDGRFDGALAQLVLHFVTDSAKAASEMRRVLRPGGVAAACVWDFAKGMRLLRCYWDAALAVNAHAPDESTTLPFGRDGEIAELFTAAGFKGVTAGALEVEAHYDSFADLWSGFTHGAGPAAAFCASLDDERREALRSDLARRLGDPQGAFTLPARAWYATGRA